MIDRDNKTSWDNIGAWRCNVCLSCRGKESVLLDNFSNEGEPLVYNPTCECACSCGLMLHKLRGCDKLKKEYRTSH